MLCTECNGIRHTALKTCDETNSNITTQFVSEHVLTVQVFLQVFNVPAPGYAADIQAIF
jgi:hypothetical protein